MFFRLLLFFVVPVLVVVKTTTRQNMATKTKNKKYIHTCFSFKTKYEIVCFVVIAVDGVWVW